KGVKFGASRSDVGFISERDWLKSDTSSSREHCSGEYLGAERCERIEPIGDVGATLTYYFRDNKLVEIDGSFLSGNYAQLRDIFIGTYGKPHQSEHNAERTTFGATVQDESLAWTGRFVRVFITKYLGTITDGGFSISLTSEDLERQRIKRETRK